MLKTADGVYAGKSGGGLGPAHGELNCPHGITHEPRRKLLLTADRGNKRLDYFTLSGFYDSPDRFEQGAGGFPAMPYTNAKALIARLPGRTGVVGSSGLDQ